MQELIKITEQNGQQVVSARELHEFLVQEAKGGQQGRMFAHWIVDIIERFGFVQGQDFTVLEYDYTGKPLDKNGKSDNQRVHRRDYALTIDMAKQVAMVQNNNKGTEARKYFIACEKALKQVKLPTPKELALLLIQSEEEKERLAAEVEQKTEVIEQQTRELLEAAPHVAFAKEVLTSTSTYNTNLIAKELGTSAVTLNSILKQNGIQYKQGETWILANRYQNKGYTKTKTYSYTSANGEIKTSMQTVWTETGRRFIHEIMKKRNLVAV